MKNLTDNIFIGKKVRLTALRKDDIPIMQRWNEDAGYLRLYNSDPAEPNTEASLNKQLEDWDTSQTQKQFIMRPIKSDECLGNVGLSDISWSNGTCSLGITIGNRKNWRQGYGRDAMNLLLNYAFNELNLHRIGLTVFEYNTAALALYESLGFQREGTLRDFVHRDGKRYAMYWYSLLRPEWETQ
ncbi:MAG: GNAT family N-acetyltransferase [Candidatus Latescibacteria bacterium]|nr:GNAT family N-acetyltransferase [Candidatus Latescibacterota bacterium]MBT5833006.1 GNAT family N-acetyltransferase [Candidatus Latescibacterota bacterium]